VFNGKGVLGKMEGVDVMVPNEDLLELIPLFDKGGSI
jgi:hypothetical protein